MPRAVRKAEARPSAPNPVSQVAAEPEQGLSDLGCPKRWVGSVEQVIHAEGLGLPG